MVKDYVCTNFRCKHVPTIEGVKGRKGFFSGKIINTYDYKRPKEDIGTVLLRCYPSECQGSEVRWPIHPLSSPVPQFTHFITYQTIRSVGVLVIMLNMLCV